MKKIIFQFSLLFIVLFFVMYSCANTSTPPSGGAKDTIPPVLVKVHPDSNTVNFPLKGTEVELKFDEYVVLKDAVKNVYISPPQKKKLETKIRSKSIIVTFPLPLDSSTTYSINFGNSISDNNEGNPLKPYVYSFSTGKAIDSMLCAGVILDSRTLFPREDVSIGFYLDQTDSAAFNKFPSVIARSDKWGYFVARNLKSAPYRIVAFNDGNGNNKYDPENEEVAFCDSVIVPTKVMRKNMTELKYVSMKDTSKALARPSQTELYLFKEMPQKQYIKDKKRPERKMAYIKFNAPEVRIDSMGFKGIDSAKTIRQFNIKRDSLVIWIADTLMRVPDTIDFVIKYYKTDSLNKLVLTREVLKLAAPKPKKVEKPDIRRLGNPNEKPPRPDLLTIKIDADPSLIEYQGFRLLFPSPLVKMKLDSVILSSKTPKGVKSKEKVNLIKDASDQRLYFIKPNIRWLQGYEYSLILPKGAFKDIYGFTNDSTITTVSLPNSEKLSKLTLDIKGTDGSYLIELTNQTRDKVYRSYKISADSKLEFPYIQPGKYNIRITQDLNGNGILDTGNLLKRKQPEKIRLYHLKNGSSVIDFKEGVDLEQNINLKQIFK